MDDFENAIDTSQVNDAYVDTSPEYRSNENANDTVYWQVRFAIPSPKNPDDEAQWKKSLKQVIEGYNTIRRAAYDLISEVAEIGKTDHYG